SCSCSMYIGTKVRVLHVPVFPIMTTATSISRFQVSLHGRLSSISKKLKPHFRKYVSFSGEQLARLSFPWSKEQILSSSNVMVSKFYPYVPQEGRNFISR
ncbi:conserved hypothetical protein, partial [Ricinus communis]